MLMCQQGMSYENQLIFRDFIGRSRVSFFTTVYTALSCINTNTMMLVRYI
jgi:hypothetical protein